MYKEFGDTGWTWRAVGYQTIVAYMVAVVIYQSSLVFTHTIAPVGLIIGIIALALMIYGVFIKRESGQFQLTLN